MSRDYGGECPYCGSASEHLNNHIRMSGGDHSSQGSYPENWEPESREQVESDPETSDPGQTVDGLTDDESEAVPIELEDDARDAREYECENCGADLPYLVETCPSCDQSNRWQGVSV